MSRVAKSPITLPAGVEVIIKGQDVQVKGGKGVLSIMLNDLVAVSQELVWVTKPLLKAKR